jgi:hypothetical protein
VNDAEKFLVWCGLTCMGGSARKACPCAGPTDCAMREHPDFETQRLVAVERLARCAANEVRAKKMRDDFFRQYAAWCERAQQDGIANYLAERETDPKEGA